MTTEKCVWESIVNLLWSPQCGPKYQTVVGDQPKSFSYCPYCGKPIEVKEDDNTC